MGPFMPADLSASLTRMMQHPWALALGAFALWMIVFLAARGIILRSLRKSAAGTRLALGEVVVKALRTPLLIAIVAGGLLIVDRALELSARWDRAFDVLLAAAIVFALVLFVDRLTRGILDRLARESMALQGARGLIQGTVRGVVVAVGLLIFLDSIGVSITPLLASLGVGSLAVALALQDTLSNLFAGLYIVADKPLEAGHLVKLEGSEEGYVVKVGWRSTWIRTLSNNILVLPNSRMAGSVITNFTLSDPALVINLPAAVRYDSDLSKVERVTLEVAREVMRAVEGGVSQFEPSVRFQAFGESGITLVTALRCQGFEAQALVRHEFLRRLHERYRREGIAVPFPTRTLDLPRPGLAPISEALSPDPEGRHA